MIMNIITIAVIIFFGWFTKRAYLEFFSFVELMKVAHRFTEMKAFKSARDAWALNTVMTATVVVALIGKLLFG
jgi:hypothetical protein